MRTVKVRNIHIGEGRPKICVSLMGLTTDELLEQAHRVCSLPCDIVEWRADCFEEILNEKYVKNVLAGLRGILGDRPLLFTFRTLEEGGFVEVSPKAYADLNRVAVVSGNVDLIDLELLRGSEDILNFAHSEGVKVISSNHDFNSTPSRQKLVSRLLTIESIGADIAKVAVMPRDQGDVLNLFESVWEAKQQGLDCPVIVIAMGAEGLMSRLCGELLGFAVTFGAGTKKSAPGQIGAEDLYNILELIHKVK